MRRPQVCFDPLLVTHRHVVSHVICLAIAGSIAVPRFDRRLRERLGQLSAWDPARWACCPSQPLVIPPRAPAAYIVAMYVFPCTCYLHRCHGAGPLAISTLALMMEVGDVPNMHGSTHRFCSIIALVRDRAIFSFSRPANDSWHHVPKANLHDTQSPTHPTCFYPSRPSPASHKHST